MSNGIFLSSATIQSLDASLRAAILEAAGLADRSTSINTDLVSASVPEELAVLSDRQARKFLDGLQPRTRDFLEALVDLPPLFLADDLSSRLGIARDKWRLGGVLSGLTKRVHTVTGENDVFLIVWSEPDAQGFHKYGQLHPSTHQALCRALGK